MRNRAWRVRLATEQDAAELEALIPLSVRKLQAAYYSETQMEAALGVIFALDHQLIRDATYLVAEESGKIVGCGGWSKRRSHYGGDAGRNTIDPELDPATDAARVRAFFVHPDWARQSIGRAIMEACETAIRKAKFRKVEIVATLTGEPLYAAFGYRVTERYDIQMAGDLGLPAVRMEKTLDS